MRSYIRSVSLKEINCDGGGFNASDFYNFAYYGVNDQFNNAFRSLLNFLIFNIYNTSYLLSILTYNLNNFSRSL